MNQLEAATLIRKHLNKIFTVGLLIILSCSIALYFISEDRNKIKISYEQGRIKELEKQRKLREKEFEKEIKLRSQQRYLDSVDIAHLKAILKRDSIENLKTRRWFRAKLKEQRLTNEELDRQLREAYEESTNNDPTP
jgi:hypothetical protein